ncbi:hypothetical protein B0I27_101117 [Arcticibacter pallidicorallinus]|uniref:Lipoprotein n=1 Tax=Arcticibacter pallidicorallinus TaxID=1259464 RepID=A0A2T0UB53_9SPHI|nr:hypothetical protein [Arcticibacter pallidicorallinus]PRY55149.1 hypothetical protein B0I27_101117 [Arcticibacter pallidicorallinus]
MKTNIPAILFLVSAVFFGCGSGQEGKQSQQNNETAEDLIKQTQCYVAIDGPDTAYLNLDSRADGKISGKLLIDFSEKPDNEGGLDGEFKGDTLYVNYTFTTGESKTIYKNPLAFLKDNNRLLLGVGEIESYLGKSYFKKGTAIDFERGRFKFDPIDCQDQKLK